MSRSATEWATKPQLKPDEYVCAEIYTNPELFQEELVRLKRATWKFACHESEIPNPNDYRTFDHAGVPIIVTRSSDGNLHAFVNACSHRGAMVLREPSGNAAQWTCLFHFWTYDNFGGCTQISREAGYEESGICKAKMGLREIRLGQKFGLIFINLEDNAASFEEFFGDSFENLAEVLGTKELEVFHHHKATVKANWKQWHETNMELYHEYLHVVNRQVAMTGEGFFDREWKVYPYGHATLTPMVQKFDRMKGWKARTDKPLPGLGPSEFRIVTFFPDTTIIVRATAMRIDTSTPIAPGLTLVEQRGLGIKGEPAEDRTMRVKHHNQFWGPFGRNFPEDAIAVEAVYETVRNGASPFGLFARHEGTRGQDDYPVRMFYEEWARYMGRPASAPQSTNGA
ncbi:MAG: aromatic ring-hydroxylating oxygenase subunit alpha [Casimicrobiaceae bacterium]